MLLCSVSLITGGITTAAGFIGVALGTATAAKVKQWHKNGDALVCAWGLLLCTPFLLGVVIIVEFYIIPAWVCPSNCLLGLWFRD